MADSLFQKKRWYQSVFIRHLTPGAQHYTHLGDRAQCAAPGSHALARPPARRMAMRDGGEAALAACQRHAVRHPKRRARLFERRRARRAAVGHRRALAGPRPSRPLGCGRTLTLAARTLGRALRTPRGRASARPRPWCGGKTPRFGMPARRIRRPGWAPSRATRVQTRGARPPARVRPSASLGGGWGGRSDPVSAVSATAPSPPPGAAPVAWLRRTRPAGDRVSTGRRRVPWARWRGDIAWVFPHSTEFSGGACHRSVEAS